MADLLRITGALPQQLKFQGVTEGRFAPVLFDYRYFKNRLAIEQKVEASADLLQLDETFREAGFINIRPAMQ